MKRLIVHTLIIGWLFNACYAATPHYPEHMLSIDGGKIAYFQIGTGSKPILLLHGLFAKKTQWLNLVNTLLQQDPQLAKQYQFIIPDLPGYANSTGFPFAIYNISHRYNKNLNQARVLHDFMHALHIHSPINIAGSSMGGFVGYEYARQYSNQVATLAFIGSPAGAAPYTACLIKNSFAKGFNISLPTTINQFKTQMKFLMVNAAAYIPDDETIREKILPRYQQNYRQMSHIFDFVTLQANQSHLQHIMRITTPTLIFWGANDRYFGGANVAKRFQARFKNTTPQLIIFNNAGHLLLLEQQSVLNKIAKAYRAFLK